MEISLSDKERDLLVHLLSAHVRDLRSAVYHAESHEVKVDLKDSEAMTRALLERLQGIEAEAVIVG